MWESRVTFEAFCSFLDSVQRESDKKRRVAKLERFVFECRKIISASGDPTASLYPVMRLLLPALDRERGSYNVRETLLAKIYVDLLKLGPGSADASRLKNYRAPKGGGSGRGDAGDFAAVLYSVIKDRCSDDVSGGGGAMNLQEVNSHLDDLVSASATDGRRGVERVLMTFFRRSSASQQKWLARIVLKDVRSGLGQKAVMDACHPDAADLFDVNANLRKVCETLRDPSVRRNEIDVELFNPFKPMLADRCAVRDITKHLGDKQFYVEVKYDGERMQLHMDQNGQFRFFSRNGFDFSDDFGRSADGDSDKFSWHAARALKPEVKSIILDGEICAYNHQTGSLTQKGEQMNIRNLRSDDPLFQQCLYLYDIAYLNGEVLTNRPLRDRLETLHSVVNLVEGRVQFADRKVGRDRRDVVEALNQAIDRREEGIVLKDPDSVYKPGARARGGWIKIKPEYAGGLMDQCDLIVMGGYYGSGKRGGQVTHFLLGLAVDPTDEGHPTSFRSFCRVGSGYSQRELFDLLRRLEPHFRKSPPGSKASPPGYEYGALKEKPDVWIEPKKSVLLQVKAAEIVASKEYKVGYTLRFPRVEKVRSSDDKPWHACMTIGEMDTIRKEGEGKLAARHMVDGDDEADEEERGSAAKKKRKASSSTQSKQRVAAVSSLYKSSVDASRLMVVSHGLKGRTVVVEPTTDARLKERLERVVAAHGGNVEQNVREKKTYCLVETGYKIRARAAEATKTCDVVSRQWLLEQEDAKTLEAYRPHQVASLANAETADRFARDFDRFGDGFSCRATEASLKFSLEKVAELGAKANVTAEDMADFADRYFETPYKYGLFWPARIHFCRFSADDDGRPSEFHPLSLVEAEARFHGATVSASLEEGVTHAVVHTEDAGAGERAGAARQARRRMDRKFHLVTQEWVAECVESGRMVDEADFEPKF